MYNKGRTSIYGGGCFLEGDRNSSRSSSSATSTRRLQALGTPASRDVVSPRVECTKRGGVRPRQIRSGSRDAGGTQVLLGECAAGSLVLLDEEDEPIGVSLNSGGEGSVRGGSRRVVADGRGRHKLLEERERRGGDVDGSGSVPLI